ncbi:MAG TPA: exonuclease SbcC [Nitrosopumilaceae archaeon]|nr:exonuclease SbcC [Nitrosopumilaceae archaeon]
MVFGWGKKKADQVPEEIPQSKEIQIHEVQKITKNLLDLRASQTLAQITSIRNQTSPLIKELANIVGTLERDDLKVEEIDKHLRIIVVRGKKQVIDVIKKDVGDLPEVSSIDDIIDMNNVLNQKLKRIGDVLGRQTRVIHIFAKKYAGQLKEILAQMNSNHHEIQKLIKNFQDTTSESNEITVLLDKIAKLEGDFILKNKKILESKNKLDSFKTQIKDFEVSIEKIKSNEQYAKFLKLNQSLHSLNDTKNEIKTDIDAQFTKISRPLSRYEYASSLDKEQKSLLSQLLNVPFDALIPKNNDSIIVIFENVRKGILSGSISVKDVEKSITYLTETEELIGEFIKKIHDFTGKREEIQTKLSGFDNMELTTMQRRLEKTLNQKHDIEFKISSLGNEINETHGNIPKMISEIENKLKIFSNTDYSIIRPT